MIFNFGCWILKILNLRPHGILSTLRKGKDDFSDAPVGGVGASGGAQGEVAIGLWRGEGESVGA